MKIFFLNLCLLFSCSFLSAQDLFVKSYPSLTSQNQNIHIEALEDGSFVVAGYSNSFAGLSKVFVRKFNPCGNELWSKEISDPLLDMNLTGLNIDSNQNIIVSGIYDTFNQNPKPYLIKLATDGTTIYSKIISSTLGYNSLTYSSAIAANGDLLMSNLYRYTPNPPSNFKLSLTRLDSNGAIKWTKNYDNIFAGVWFVMSATRDNGAIINMSNTVYKVDSLGDVEWAKNYVGLQSQRRPIETDSGFVFAKYALGGLDRGNIISLHHDGSVDWFTESFINFFPQFGITRRNGNILFPGTNNLSGNSAVFLELDFTNGNIVNFNQIQNINGVFPTDLAENINGDIYFAGPDNRGILPQLVTGKLNDTLSTVACADTLLGPPSDPYILSEIGDLPISSVGNNDVIAVNQNFTITTISIFPAFTDCSFTEAKGTYSLGNDTSLCIGQSVILGNSNSDFDAYLWSNGSNNKTIGVNQSGTYWLQVISACDTLRDSINVFYIPGILFSLGPDTLACQDSITLGANLNPSNNYHWSTGDTTTTVSVKNSGIYWVEHTTKCSSYRDSITVTFSPPLAPIDLGNDTILCPKQIITIGDTNFLYATYQWSDSSSDKTIVVSSPGVYWLKASDTCNVSIDSIRIMYYPEIGLDLGADTALCFGDSLVLGENLNFNNYLWSDSSTNSTFTVKQSGIYWLEVETNCGLVRDSIIISGVPPLIAPSLFNDTIICKGTSIELTAGILPDYIWSTGETSPSINVSDSAIYWVETRNACDTLRDSIYVGFHTPLTFNYSISNTSVYTGDSIEFINSTMDGSNPTWSFGNGDSAFTDILFYYYPIDGIYIGSLSLTSPQGCIQSDPFQMTVLLSEYFAPNIFSPNNDGTNDLFQPFGKDIERFETTIYNRWGDVIFESGKTAWDGKNNSNVRVKEGTYNYLIKLTFKNGRQEILKGNVSLIR